MNGLAVMAAGLGLFILAHALPAHPAMGPAARARLGALGRKAVVALASLGGIALVVIGWGTAGGPSFWTPPAWLRHVTLALMLPALVLVVAAYAPFGRIAKFARHPMLAGVKIWAFSHLLVNADARSLLLFGALLAYAVLARILLKRRGDLGRSGAPSLLGDAIALVGGAAAYGALAFWLHPILFGVAVVG